MNYKIIQDEQKLLSFINWLPDLKDGEAYYINLFGRNKYAKEAGLTADKQSLKRLTTTKEFIFDKIKQMECEVGMYKQKNIPIPQEALAVYITPNPRSYEQAAKNSLINFAKKITEPYSGYNPHQDVLSEIQKACGRKIFYDFDYDHVDLDTTIKEGEKFINFDAVNILVTRGGFHFLVRLDRIDSKFTKTWFNGLKNLAGSDVRGDGLMPVPGCSQGNFTPYFSVKWKND